MKAIVYDKYGPPDVLELREIAAPIPKDNEVLIKVFATTVHIGDVKMRKADPFLARLFNGLLKPKRIKVLGFELSGVVEDAGNKVSDLKIGDEVYAFTGFRFGAYAEYKCIPIDGKAKSGLVVKKPDNISFEEAAAVPGGGITALTIIRKANISQGQSVLIYGASGSVGSFAVQIACAMGAAVTAVCRESNFEAINSLGAVETIDYTSKEFTELDTKFDVVFDAVAKLPISHAKSLLRKKGILLNVQKDSGSGLNISKRDLEYLKELIESGKLRPLIDKVYDFDQMVEAHRYVDQGHKKGNVVIQVSRKTE